jgi:hypothetical protein
VREKLPHLAGQLGGQRLFGRDDQGGSLDRFDAPGDGGALAAARDAEESLEPVAAPDALGKVGDGGRLVASRGKIGHHLELGHDADGIGTL